MTTIIFDLETTGLPLKKSRSEYYNYKILEKYENSRIVQIGYICIDEDYNVLYEREYKIRGVDLKGSEKYHNITENILEREGYEFECIVNNMYNDFMRCETLLAHNLSFDYNILLSELYRRGYINFVEMLKTKGKICSMIRLKNEVNKIGSWGGVKYPSLDELYKHVFGDDYEIEGAHDALNDSRALLDSLRVLKNVNGVDIIKSTKNM